MDRLPPARDQLVRAHQGAAELSPALRDWRPPDLTNDLETFGAQSWPAVKRLLAA